MLTKASFDEWCRSQENGYDAWMAWQEAAKRENAECAKVCEEMPGSPSIRLLCKAFGEAIRSRDAAAIRARSEPS